jgi:hypothetical protein
LGEDRKLQITTADTTVTVHGTVFSVEVQRTDLGLSTTVSVTRGLVAVDRKGTHVMLSPGHSWTSGDSQAQPTRPEPSAAIEPNTPVVNPTPNGSAVQSSSTSAGPASRSAVSRSGLSRDSVPRGGAVSRGSAASKQGKPAPRLTSEERTDPASSEADARSQLAEQNRLFEQAMHARDAGDDQVAATLLRQLLSKYPDSPLESTAVVELARARKRLEQDSAP